MKIMNKEKGHSVKFQNVICGQVFRYDKKIYLKIIAYSGAEAYYDAVSLDFGELTCFNDFEEVEVLEDAFLD